MVDKRAHGLEVRSFLSCTSCTVRGPGVLGAELLKGGYIGHYIWGTIIGVTKGNTRS